MIEPSQEKKLVKTFLLEAWEGLVGLEQGLTGLGTTEDGRARDAIIVLSHRLRGSAALYGYPQLSDLAGSFERLARQLAGQTAALREAAQELFTDSLQTLQQIFDRIAKGESEEVPQAAVLHRRYEDLLNRAASPAPMTPSDGVDGKLLEFRREQQRALSFFGPEALEHVEGMAESLADLEKDPVDAEALHRLFRQMHTLKGAAFTVGCAPFGELAHRLEEIIVAARKGFLTLDAEGLGRGHQALDVFRTMLDALHGSARSVEQDYARALQSLDVWLDSVQSAEVPAAPDGEGESEADSPAASAREDQGTEDGQPGVPAAEAAAPAVVPATATPSAAAPSRDEAPAVPAPLAGFQSTVRVDLDRMDSLMNLVGELVISRSRLDRHLDAIEQANVQMAASRVRLVGTLDEFGAKYLNPGVSASARPGRETERAGGEAGEEQLGSTAGELFAELEFDRYDDFNILSRQVGELSSDFGEVHASLERQVGQLRGDVEQIQKLIRDLRGGISRVRMVPVGQLFSRFRRLVDQASAQAGKSVRLELSGEAVEVDNAVIEQVAGPLMHLVQNAIFHGLEEEEERLAGGKESAGTLLLTAVPQGQYIHIEVEDDGRGIDLQALAEAAARQGFRKAEELAKLGEDELVELMFLPGLSTTRKVTTAAGRGVGMDVVRTNIARLNGEIRIETEQGVGTRIILRLPLTLLVSEAVIARAGGETFGIPIPAVRKLLYLRPEDITQEDDQERVEVEGESLRLLRLAQILGLPGTAGTGEMPAIVVQSGGLLYTLLVDEVLDIEEIVIRNLGGFLEELELFSGATITGDGRVILLLDPLGVNALSKLALDGESEERPEAGSQVAVAEKPSVLLVDDSLSVRKVLGDMLLRDGYEVTVATDGLHAIEVLRAEKFNAVITDLEMPRLNGYELSEDLRRRHGRSELPVFVITTRAGQKHLDMARRLGANGYFTKPIDDQALLDQLRESLSQSELTGEFDLGQLRAP